MPAPQPESSVGEVLRRSMTAQPSSEEPTSRRQPIAWSRLATTGIKIAIVALVATVALGVAAFAAASSYTQYGAIKNTPNARAWSGLTPQFAGQAICASCHAPEADTQDASIHVNVSCEDLPRAPRGSSASNAAAGQIEPPKPPDKICATCHAAVPGRPSTFPQIVEARHYSGDHCLRCHDPHSIVATRPPTVSHPLDNLPACTVCHGPDGLKKVPSGHELVADSVCLSCHHPATSRRP